MSFYVFQDESLKKSLNAYGAHELENDDYVETILEIFIKQLGEISTHKHLSIVVDPNNLCTFKM